MQQQIIDWMASTKIAYYMGAWQWAWPTAEAFHFVGMALLFGSILVMDVRLMGFFRKDISLHAVHALTPYGLVGFLINLITGACFVLKDAARYIPNPDCWFKLACILLAGVNFLVFWFVIRKQLEKLPDDGNPALSAKAVGFSSIVLWTLVIWGGRMIPVYGVG